MGILSSTPSKPQVPTSNTTKLSRSSVIIQKKRKTGQTKSSSTVDMLRAALSSEVVRPVSRIPTVNMTVQVDWGDGCWFVLAHVVSIRVPSC